MELKDVVAIAVGLPGMINHSIVFSYSILYIVYGIRYMMIWYMCILYIVLIFYIISLCYKQLMTANEAFSPQCHHIKA